MLIDIKPEELDLHSKGTRPLTRSTQNRCLPMSEPNDRKNREPLSNKNLGLGRRYALELLISPMVLTRFKYTCTSVCVGIRIAR